MKTIRTKAIVLRRTNYGESDRIVQIITPEYGKISVIARGVRREKSKLAGGIELFARCDLTLHQGRGELFVLTGTRLEQFYGTIMTEYDRLTFGYEALKQIAKAADTLDEPAFFELLDQVLSSLNDQAIDLRVVRTWFWLQLAILLGDGLNLATDDQGDVLKQNEQYDFDEQQGVLRMQTRGRYSADHIKLLRIMSAHSPRMAMQVGGLDDLIDDCLWLAERAVAH